MNQATANSATNRPTSLIIHEGVSAVTVRGKDFEVDFIDGKIHVRSGEIVTNPSTNKISTTTAPTAPKIGDIIQDGPNAGWIYCEADLVEPFLVAPKDSGIMKWRAAMDFAKNYNSKLPNRLQLDAMYLERNTGAFRDTFNLSGTHDSTYFSAMRYDHDSAWGQRFYNRQQVIVSDIAWASVRRVRSYSIA